MFSFLIQRESNLPSSFARLLFYVLSNSVALIHQKTQERITCLEAIILKENEDIPSCFAYKDKMDQSVHITDC